MSKNIRLSDNNIYNNFMNIQAKKNGSARYSQPAGLQKDTLETHLRKNTSIIKPSKSRNITPGGSDDGKIPLKEKITNFGKGLISPITTMFSSPKNFLKGAAGIAACAGLIVLTNGFAAPVLVAAGIAGGVIQIGKGISGQLNAQTDEEARQAWQQMGSGTFSVGVSAISAKPALRAANVSEAANMSTFGAVIKCFKDCPKNIINSVTSAGQKISGLLSSLNMSSQGVKSGGTGGSYSDMDIIEDDGSYIRIIDEKVIKEPIPNNNTTISNEPTAAGTDRLIQETVNMPDTKQLPSKPQSLTPVTSTGKNLPAKNLTLGNKFMNLLKIFGFFK